MVCVGWEVNYFQITDVETIPMEALNAKATTAHLLLDEACQLNIEETGIGWLWNWHFDKYHNYDDLGFLLC